MRQGLYKLRSRFLNHLRCRTDNNKRGERLVTTPDPVVHRSKSRATESNPRHMRQINFIRPLLCSFLARFTEALTVRKHWDWRQGGSGINDTKFRRGYTP
jgi:hypothetical protein